MLNELRQFGLKIRGENYEITKVVIKHNNHLVRTILTYAVGTVFLVILLSLLILIYKNRQLRKAYRNLYMVNLDVIAAKDKERRIRAHYEGQIEAFKEMLQSSAAGSDTKKKYQNSTLDEDNKAVLASRILQLFDDTEEIFAPDFNMNKLATLVGSNYKNVSQVINEQFGRNFNTLLNEYRTKEACRRLNDITNYGNRTIESIGESVGFGSRSTFIATFKKITGLTPSEFQHQAKTRV